MTYAVTVSPNPHVYNRDAGSGLGPEQEFHMLIHGKTVTKRGNRFFAVPKPENRAGRIAMLTQLPANLWARVLASPVGGHVICNQKRADGRRDARMARLARGATRRFAKC